jgi:hypothetical protein
MLLVAQGRRNAHAKDGEASCEKGVSPHQYLFAWLE